MYLVAVATVALSLGNPKGRAGRDGRSCPAVAPTESHPKVFISKSSDKENTRLGRGGVVLSGRELKREGCLPGQKLVLGSKEPAPISSR